MPKKKLTRREFLASRERNAESAHVGSVEVLSMPRKRRIPRSLQEALAELKAHLQDFYGTRLVSVTLYGPYARGDGDRDSDIDVVVALKGCTDPVAERARLNEILVELDLKHDTLISVAVTDIEDLKCRRTRFIINVRREGVRV